MKPLWSAIKNRWSLISVRERRLLVAGGVAIGVALVWWLDDWQRQERAYLARAIPAAEAQLNSIRTMAVEYQQYTAQTGGVSAAPVTSDVLVSSLKNVAPSIEATPVGTGQIQVKGDLAFDRWVVWLGSLPARGWRLESVEITLVGNSGAATGLVRVDARLAAIATK